MSPSAQTSQTAPADPAQELPPEAAFWKARYEEERIRLAKLLVAYRDLEAELRRAKQPPAAPAPAAAPAGPPPATSTPAAPAAQAPAPAAEAPAAAGPVTTLTPT